MLLGHAFVRLHLVLEFVGQILNYFNLIVFKISNLVPGDVKCSSCHRRIGTCSPWSCALTCAVFFEHLADAVALARDHSQVRVPFIILIKRKVEK